MVKNVKSAAFAAVVSLATCTAASAAVTLDVQLSKDGRILSQSNHLLERGVPFSTCEGEVRPFPAEVVVLEKGKQVLDFCDGLNIEFLVETTFESRIGGQIYLRYRQVKKGGRHLLGVPETTGASVGTGQDFAPGVPTEYPMGGYIFIVTLAYPK